ncbi:ATP-binding cassette domain-containing protein [Microaerobacter geothermalis]|uniref:ATP-binding cassette domain-containing protein n=1 Tax=Microaerobacter geothermalis TaxID=674972 RepID=UPI001F1BFEAC|nr:ATP-binding cassette domain-containing protein [Microaerobacter geothermalis]MCF6093439.1 ATP-binding cassette domain-containing protein [Microaerobacter geothermalis]
MTWAIETKSLTKTFKQHTAVKEVSLTVPKGEIFGLLGPDGAGKTTLTQMLCSVLLPTSGEGRVAGLDVVKEAEKLRGKIGYMSEGFSLYGTLSVEENINFFADMYQVPVKEREKRKERLLKASRLEAFTTRRADNLSGGMKKKLALCCTLVYHPEIIFLDEPTTGVDPVSRRDFWNILHDYVSEGTSVFVCTPYMDEAERFNRVALMYQGEIITMDSPYQIKRRVSQLLGKEIVNLEEAFIYHIEEKLGKGHQEDVFISKIQPIDVSQGEIPKEEIAVQVKDLTKTFGSFTAVNHINLTVKKGEIFGFLGPNGSGKSTAIRMMCGLLPATSGEMYIAGVDVKKSAHNIKRKIGYMSQKFSLYKDLTVEENIRFYAGAYGLTKNDYLERKEWILEMADLKGKEKIMTSDLSGGWKQRLALGCATIHEPEILFLDEPTSGVDPIARRQFWTLINHLAAEGVTIFITTHYMDEAEHCDRIGFIYLSNLIAVGSPIQLKKDLFQGNLLEVECNRPFEAQNFLVEMGIDAAIFGNGLHIMPSKMPFQKIIEMLKEKGFQLIRQAEVPVSMEDVFVKLVENELKKREGIPA